MDVLLELATFPKWSQKTQMDHSSFLQTANEIKSFIGFCFPSSRQKRNYNYTWNFFHIIRRRTKKSCFLLQHYQFRHENENVYLLLLQRLSTWSNFYYHQWQSSYWFQWELGCPFAGNQISLSCDNERSAQSQGIEKQPTKMWKNILQKYPAIISVGVVIILGEVNNASGLWKHAAIRRKHQIVGKLIPEERSLCFKNDYFKTDIANIFKLTFLKHRMRGVWIWYDRV